MKEEPKLKKNINCVHCEHVIKCKGAINPAQCINFKERKEKE